MPTKKGYYKGNGIYPITFTPNETGLYEYKVKSANQPIKGKLFYGMCENVDNSPDPVNSIIDGPKK